MLAGLLRDLAQLTASPSGLTALAATVLAGAMLAAALALVTSVAGVSRTAALPLIGRARALQEKSWQAAFLRQRDPDAAGRTRPRAPSAAQAAATSR
jgi:acetylglutamate kinase